MAKSKSRRKTADRAVKRIPPSSQEARDEGPRLIPLGRVPEEPRVLRYLELAGVALNRRNAKNPKSRRQAGPPRCP